MNIQRGHLFVILLAAIVAAAVLLYGVTHSAPMLPQASASTGRPPLIDPDYSGCTIPPNIAPLNFVIKDDHTEHRVNVHNGEGDGFVVASHGPAIRFPLDQWQSLLAANAGKELHFDIYSREKGGRWLKYDTITNHIATEKIDPYIAYRLLGPLHNRYSIMGTYQRNLETFEQSPILASNNTQRCVNCHTFASNNPDRMLLHLRGKDGVAMLLAKGESVQKVNTRTKFNPSPAAYSSWHPSGKVVAFSVNSVVLIHHTTGNSRDVFDFNSDLGMYRVSTNEVFSTGKISDPRQLETYPAWSPDGKYLYFCRTPLKWDPDIRKESTVPFTYKQVRYDLMRISYNVDTDAWGELETVLSEKDTGLSITEPKVSPDGRFLLFCMAEYGNFPIYMNSADLYMLDLQTGEHRPLKHNSPLSESWHSWSANGRWIAFASKRRDNIFGKIYFSYIDENGNDHRPILMPQESPTFYDSCLRSYNVPEFSVKRIPWEQEDFERAIASSEQGLPADVISGATSKHSAPREHYQSLEAPSPWEPSQ